jgi:nucleotide-binding universal stress UspA family protein
MNAISHTGAKPVVACLDGTDDGHRAMLFAITRARLLHTELRLLHVVPTLAPFAPKASVIGERSMDEISQTIMKDAVTQCARLAPDLSVSVGLRYEDTYHVFSDESKHAECLVLGSRSQPPFRSGAGSTTNLACVAAECPVFAVPHGWQQDGEQGPVVVAVSYQEEITDLVSTAMAECELRRTQLVVLHAWRPLDGYAHASADTEDPGWVEAATRELAEATAGVRADHPDVAVNFKARYQSPPVALAEAAADACLVVVGRHHNFLPMFSGLGRMTQAALHANTCPVEILPPARTPSDS